MQAGKACSLDWGNMITMLERRMSKDLEQWKQKKKKKAFLITGAGRTGKTHCIRNFGEEQYENLAEINFREDQSAAAVFTDVSDAEKIIKNIIDHTGQKIEPGKTLIFLDEIQECEQAREAVKVLVRDGRYDIAQAGEGLRPAYYEEAHILYPLDFEEFLNANGIRKETIEYVRDCYERGWEASGSVHEMLKRLFRYYAVVGGMPEAVLAFVDSHDMDQVTKIQKDILETYRKKIAQPSPHVTGSDRGKMRKILDFIPVELGKENKRFLLADIRKSARMERYENSLNRLSDLGLTLPCYHVSRPGYPLEDTEKKNLFKLYLVDSGLLHAMYPEDVQAGMLQNPSSGEMSVVLENAFAQILAAKGFALRYFNEKKKGELDLLIQNREEVIPIEIRSGVAYKDHSALSFVMSREDLKLQKGMVFCEQNMEKDGKILYLPWYTILFLEK